MAVWRDLLKVAPPQISDSPKGKLVLLKKGSAHVLFPFCFYDRFTSNSCITASCTTFSAIRKIWDFHGPVVPPSSPFYSLFLKHILRNICREDSPNSVHAIRTQSILQKNLFYAFFLVLIYLFYYFLAGAV